MNTLLKPLFLLVLLGIVVSSYSINPQENDINISNEFSLKNTNFLFADAEIKSILTLSKKSVEKFPQISIEKILEESIKFIDNLRLINTLEGKINDGKKADTLMCKSCINTFNTLNFIVKESYKSANALNILEIIWKCSEGQ